MSARPEIQPGERRLLPSGRLVQVLSKVRGNVVVCRYVGKDGVVKGAGHNEQNELRFANRWLQKYGVRV